MLLFPLPCSSVTYDDDHDDLLNESVADVQQVSGTFRLWCKIKRSSYALNCDASTGTTWKEVWQFIGIRNEELCGGAQCRLVDILDIRLINSAMLLT